MYLSIRDAMLDCFDTPLAGLHTLGVEAVEVELGNDFSVRNFDDTAKRTLRTDDDARAYRQHLDQLAIRPCSLLTACDFSQGTPEQNSAWVARALELAQLMQVPNLRIDSAMKREQELDFQQRVGLFVDGLGRALREQRDNPVTLGIENHGYQGNNLGFLLCIFRRVGDPRLGVTLDTGNFYWRGYPLSEVYGIIELLAPYARHTHAKNIAYPAETREQQREGGWKYGDYVCPIEEGDIDHGRVVEILRDAGYTGDLCIEDESLGKYPEKERPAILQRDVTHLGGLLR